MGTIAENIAAVRANIAQACRAAGRDTSEITLLGASKMNDAAACRAAVAAGIDALGENRVQEMSQKIEEHAYDGVPLHFIGHLQRNKVRQVVGRVALIQSVGSEELIAAIARQAESLGIVQDVLLEVNIGCEAGKSGFLPEEIYKAAENARLQEHIRVCGLMTIPPVSSDTHGSVPFFEKVSRIFIDINEKIYDNRFSLLSMGMSGDYADAIQCGANLVRVGTAIFGARGAVT